MCAVATMACCGPSRARIERKEAPKAESDRATAWAAWRNAGARLTTFSVREQLPEMSLCRASPSHEQCYGRELAHIRPNLDEDGLRDGGRIPVTATRSTPVRRAGYVRALELG